MDENAPEAHVKKGRIIFVPTSHIARDSLLAVKAALAAERPDCIAVELDAGRYHALRSHGESSTLGLIKTLGPSTFALYWTLKKLQAYLGGKTGIFPGAEMLEAVNLAESTGIDAAFIDQPIGVTFFRIKKLPLSEKFRIFRLLSLAAVSMAFPFGKKEKIDLNALPPEKIINDAMAYIESELPGFYRVLVAERNEVMASNLLKLSGRYEKIVCVVGAAHAKGIAEMLLV